MSSAVSVLGGIALGMFTTLLSASGLAFQKRAHHELAPRRLLGPVRSYTNNFWRVGMALLIVSALLSIAVSALLGQALASSLAALTIVWALAIAACSGKRCGKGLTCGDGVAAGLCVAGTVAVVVGKVGVTANGAPFLSPNQVQATLGRPAAVALGSVVGALVAAAATTIYILTKTEQSLTGPAGMSSSQRHTVLLCLRLFLAGAFGAFTGVATKGFSTILASGFVSDGGIASVLISPLVWVFLAALIASVVCQMGSLGGALKLAPLTLVVPFYQSSLICGGALSGIVFWNETLDNLALFIAGIFVTIGGLAVKGLERGKVAAADGMETPSVVTPSSNPESTLAAVSADDLSGTVEAAFTFSPPVPSPKVNENDSLPRGGGATSAVYRRSISAPPALATAGAAATPSSIQTSLKEGG